MPKLRKKFIVGYKEPEKEHRRNAPKNALPTITEEAAAACVRIPQKEGIEPERLVERGGESYMTR
jgi:hypothetical protein